VPKRSLGDLIPPNEDAARIKCSLPEKRNPPMGVIERVRFRVGRGRLSPERRAGNRSTEWAAAKAITR